MSWYKDLKNWATNKKTEVNDVKKNIEPVRTSEPEVRSLYSILSDYIQVTPEDYPVEFVKIIKHLTIYNEDFSYALDNIVQLANTKTTEKFGTDIKDKEAQELSSYLDEVKDDWYKGGGGINSLRADLLAQCVTYGAMALERVPTKRLDGIFKVILVDPSTIVFKYDKDTYEWLPYQKITHVSKQGSQYKPLNRETFKYYALRRSGEKPYGIPPFLSALDSVTIEKDMVNNIRSIVRNLGVLGFLEVLINTPQKKVVNGVQETDKEFTTRVKSIQATTTEQVKKGMLNGFVVGFKDQHEFNMNSATSGNVQGAAQLMQINTERKAAGLKQSPFMLGRNFSTTESLGTVILTVMASSVGTYQQLLDTCQSDIYQFALLLNKNKKYRVEVISEKPLITDQVKDGQAFSIKIDNQDKLYRQGIISQTQRAKALGFDKPDVEEPRVEVKEEVIEDIEEDLAKVLAKFNKSEFDYEADCGSDCHTHISFTGEDDLLEKYLSQYSKATQKVYAEAIKRVLKTIGETLGNLPEGIDEDTLSKKIMLDIYKSWDEVFTKQELDVIAKYTATAYEEFRKDIKVFGGTKLPTGDKIPKAIFNTLDYRTMTYAKNIDVFYLGKFITDEDVQISITKYIKDKYIADEYWYKDEAKLKAFQKEFPKVLNDKSWKIESIVSTTMNRMRNTAALNYMNQVGVEEFIILGVNDQLQCPFCAGMQGKVFSVKETTTIIENSVSGGAENLESLSPFITSALQDDVSALNLTPTKRDAGITKMVKGMSSERLIEKGIAIPPYHPRCRDQIVAKL